MVRSMTRLLPWLAVVCLGVIVAGCGSTGASETATPAAATTGVTTPAEIAGDLELFAYEDGFTPGYIGPFKKMYPNLKLRATAYDSGDAAIAKMRAGFHPDVINLCVEEDAELAMRLGFIQPIDVSRIKEWDNMFPVFQTLHGVQMDGKIWMVPVDAGVTGMVYNTNEVSPAPTSFKDLFDPKYKGEVAMIDYAVTAIQVGALALGYSDPLNLTDDQLEAVKNLYIDAKKNGQFRTFYNNDSELANLFKTHEITLAMGYPSNAQDAKRAGEPVKFTLASEGQILWTCGYGITKWCRNVDAAYALINYYLSPEAEAYEAKTWNYMVTNAKTLDIVSDKVKEDANLERPKDMGNALPAAPPVQGYSKWVRLWQEVKTS
jgi:spermidine/putrescine-binding protein